MKFFLIDESTKASQTLMEKLAREPKNGAIIPLTEEEFELSRTMMEIVVPENQLQEVKPGASYLILVDPDKVHLDDLRDAAIKLEIRLGIARIAD